MRRIFADKVFIGVNRIDAEHGATAYHPDEAAFNSVMTQQARERIVVADHSKLRETATHLFCPIKDIHRLITDVGAPDEIIAAFTEKGINVQRV